METTTETTLKHSTKIKLSEKTKNTITEIIINFFILLFVYTAISKIFTHNNFQDVLSKSALIGTYSEIVAWAIPIVELIISILLIIPKTKKWGLMGTLLLMISFTGYLIYMVSVSTKLPCSCGGIISEFSWQQHIIFNCVLIGIAGIGTWLKRQTSKVHQ